VAQPVRQESVFHYLEILIRRRWAVIIPAAVITGLTVPSCSRSLPRTGPRPDLGGGAEGA
jgi:hypothetical protein